MDSFEDLCSISVNGIRKGQNLTNRLIRNDLLEPFKLLVNGDKSEIPSLICGAVQYSAYKIVNWLETEGYLKKWNTTTMTFFGDMLYYSCLTDAIMTETLVRNLDFDNLDEKILSHLQLFNRPELLSMLLPHVDINEHIASHDFRYEGLKSTCFTVNFVDRDHVGAAYDYRRNWVASMKLMIDWGADWTMSVFEHKPKPVGSQEDDLLWNSPASQLILTRNVGQLQVVYYALERNEAVISALVERGMLTELAKLIASFTFVADEYWLRLFVDDAAEYGRDPKIAAIHSSEFYEQHIIF